jgi:peptide/nickel transport system permease protein
MASRVMDSSPSRTERGGKLPGGREHRRRLPLGLTIGGLILILLGLVAALAPALARRDPLEQNIARRLQPPTREHLLGTDRLGRDLLSRLLHGARVSLVTGGLVVATAVTVGLTLGMISGYYGGHVDFGIQRVVDVVMAFPGILLAIGIMAFIGQGLANLVVAISIVNIPRVIRVARAGVLQTRQMDFVEAARALGASDRTLMVRHILPTILAPIIVQATFTLVYSIRTESTLNFLGLGVPAPDPSWGGLLDDGKSYLQTAPWLIAAPAGAIALAILSLNLLGDGLRDRLDPRQSARVTVTAL